MHRVFRGFVHINASFSEIRKMATFFGLHVGNVSALSVGGGFQTDAEVVVTREVVDSK